MRVSLVLSPALPLLGKLDAAQQILKTWIGAQGIPNGVLEAIADDDELLGDKLDAYLFVNLSPAVLILFC